MNEFSIPVRVYYEDTDSGGVVYHTNYLKFMERARTEWFRRLGFELDQLSHDLGILFVVRSLDVRYLRPARFNDLLDVTAAVTEHGPMSCTFEHIVRNAASAAEVFSRSVVRIACLESRSLRPHLIPEPIAKRMEHGG